MHTSRSSDALNKATLPEAPPPGGGRAMRPRLGRRSPPAQHTRPPSKSLDASGGGDRAARASMATPTRNAIGLSRPMACVAAVADGRLSPWRSVLPPPGGGVARALVRRVEHSAAGVRAFSDQVAWLLDADACAIGIFEGTAYFVAARGDRKEQSLETGTEVLVERTVDEDVRIRCSRASWRASRHIRA